MNTWDTAIIAATPDTEEIHELTAVGEPTGWIEKIIDLFTPNFATMGRTLNQPGHHYLVGHDKSWRLATVTKAGEVTEVDATAALAEASGQKSFVHDTMRYRITRRVR